MRIVAGVIDPGYNCSIKPGTKIETTRRNETATTTLNMHLIANRDRRSRFQLVSQVLRRARRLLLVASGLDDLDEAARIEARAADEGSVDVRLAHQFARVLWLNAPAVLNAHTLGRRIIGHLVQSVANERVGFLRLSGRRVAASANRPDRLIRNHRFLQFLWGEASETATQLDR